MKNLQGIFYALISSATFGLIPLFSIPLLEAGMGTSSILFYRLMGAALILWVIAVVMKKSFRITPLEGVKIFALGILYAVSCWVLLLSYKYIPSGMATTIHFLYPILVTFMMVVFYHERRSPQLVAAAVVSVCGVALMSWSDTLASNLTGVSLVLLTVVTYSVYLVSVRHSGVARIDSLPLTCYILLVGGVIFGFYAWCTTGVESVSTWPVAVNVVLLALIPTVISNLTLVLAVKQVGASITAILGSMEPVTAVLVGVLHFAEPFNVRYVVGLLLILAAVSGVIWTTRTSARD